MKKSLFITALASALLLQGCQLTESLKNYFEQSVELNNFEKAQSASRDICDDSSYKNLANFFSPELSKAIINECELKRKQLVQPN